MFETVRLSGETMRALARYAARATWPAGFSVYERGTAADGIFAVARGRIVLRSRVKSGRGYIPMIVTPGATFGSEGLAAASPPPPRYVTEARADEESETLHLGGTQFRALAREDPATALALTAQVLAERAAMLETLRELATLSVEQRLVASLLRMARQRTFTDGDGRLILDAAHYRVVCELVGATRESVSLVLNRLIASGAAERRDGRLLVDIEAVRTLRESSWGGDTGLVVVDERGPVVGAR